MPNLGSVAPDGPDWVPRRLKALEDRIKRLETAKVGNAMTVDGPPGITISGGGDLTIDDGGNILLLGGDLVATGGVLRSDNFVHGSTGWRLQPGGNVEVNDITLRGGIIGNDDLTDPVVPRAPHADATGFHAITTGSVPALATVSVPSGFSQALVIAVAEASCFNNTGADDTLYVAVRIDGTVPPGWAASPGVATGFNASAAAAGSQLLTGLGSSFTLGCFVKTFASDWTGGAFNTANIDATVLFLR